MGLIVQLIIPRDVNAKHLVVSSGVSSRKVSVFLGIVLNSSTTRLLFQTDKLVKI